MRRNAHHLLAPCVSSLHSELNGSVVLSRLRFTTIAVSMFSNMFCSDLQALLVQGSLPDSLQVSCLEGSGFHDKILST